jgi:hypothetical protein
MLTWVVWRKMSQLFQGARANEIRRSVTCASDTEMRCRHVAFAPTQARLQRV